MAKTTKASIIEDVLLEEILGNKELEADKSEDKTEKSDEAQGEEETQPVTESDAKALQTKKTDVAADKGEDLDTEIADTKQEKSGKKDAATATADKAPGETELKDAKKVTEVIVTESAVSSEDETEENKDEVTVTENDEVTSDEDEVSSDKVVVTHDGEEESDEEDEDLKKCDFSDDIAALDAADGSLSEAYKTKAAAIFEAAVSSKLREKSKALRESYQRQLDKKTAEVSEQMLEQVDRYLTHVAESYVEKNAAVIDANLRGEIAESFIKNLHSVFTEHYVEVPVAKRDLTAELETKVKSLEEAVAKQEGRNKILAESVVAYKRAEIIENLTKDLAATQVSKVKSLLEGVSYKDANSFRAKVETIVESYTTRPAKQDINQNPLETITESVQPNSNSIIDATMKVLANLK